MKAAEQKTAKIYTFPVRPKARSTADQLLRMEAEARAYGRVEFGSGWYHEEAIADAKCCGGRRS